VTGPAGEGAAAEPLDAWLAEARRTYHTDASAAEALAQRVLAALPADDRRRRAAAQTILGSVAFVRGNLSEATKHAREVLAMPPGAAAPDDTCEAHLLLGACARRQGDPATGILQTREALAVAEAAGAADLVAVSQNNLGIALSDVGDIEGALACYLGALEGFDEVTEGLRAQLRGSLLNNIGLLHRARSDHASALARFEDGRAAAMEAGNRREAVRIGRNLANTLLTLQRPEDAIEVLQAVAEEARAIGDAELLLSLGEVCMGQARLAQERPDLALEPLRRALDRMQRLGLDLERADYARGCALLAEALRQTGQPAEGLEVVRDGLARVHDARSRRQLLVGEVGCLKALRHWQDACGALERLRQHDEAAHQRVLADQARELRERLELEEREREAARLRSDRERLEKLVAERTADLQRASDQARAGDRAKTAFLAVASHELRTPLNAIVGYAEMVADGLGEEDPAALRSDLEQVLAAAGVLTQHVDRILAMANLEAGAEEVRFTDVAVGPLLRAVARRQQRLLQSSGSEIVVEASPELVLHTDGGLLKALLDELAQNAAKFTRSGRVVLRASRGHGEVIIEVEDDGVGIEPEVLDRIFEPFGRQDVSATRQVDGLGLGLSLCQRHAALLGGRLEVASTLGEGSVFAVVLPDARETLP